MYIIMIINIIYIFFVVQGTGCKLYQDELPDKCQSLCGVVQHQVQRNQKPDQQM